MGIIKNFIKAALGVDKKEASSPRAGSPEPSPGIDLAKNSFPARSRDSHTESDLGITMGSPLAKARDAVDDIIVTDEFRYILEKIKHTKENLFITGRAGTGKSTLLEAIAVAYGFNPEGGTKNFRFSTKDSHSELWESLTLVKRGYASDGFFLRAESFYNVASNIDRMDGEPSFGSPLIDSYGGVSLHH
ncbi:MAG: hypothetical protein K2H64_10765, partial [Desulfovibrio sp.]|nr:hypothetical protein [Desulfovibrio sp.]